MMEAMGKGAELLLHAAAQKPLYVQLDVLVAVGRRHRYTAASRHQLVATFSAVELELDIKGPDDRSREQIEGMGR